MNRFTTDGASLPRWFRRWITNGYGKRQIYLIDRAGRFHDWLAWRYPNNRKHNRRRFIRQLTRYGVEKELIRMIHFGLWVYDVSPSALRRWLRLSSSG